MFEPPGLRLGCVGAAIGDDQKVFGTRGVDLQPYDHTDPHIVQTAVPQTSARTLARASLRQRSSAILGTAQYFSPEQARAIFADPTRGCVFVLSYAWHTAGHCDPCGICLHTLLAFLEDAVGARLPEDLLFDPEFTSIDGMARLSLASVD